MYSAISIIRKCTNCLEKLGCRIVMHSITAAFKMSKQIKGSSTNKDKNILKSNLLKLYTLLFELYNNADLIMLSKVYFTAHGQLFFFRFLTRSRV